VWACRYGLDDRLFESSTLECHPAPDDVEQFKHQHVELASALVALSALAE
jgi:gamma-glutamyl:cysteine ligase YbdK (ATP-grasp superfamily)